jgi:hypothetical protein
MAVAPIWAVQNTVASVSDFVKNILIYRVLFGTCFLGLFLLPWLLLVLAYTLRALEVVIGRGLSFGSKSKGIALCEEFWTAKRNTAATVSDMLPKE